MQQTSTFTLGEVVKLDNYGGYEYVHYCSYCGNKAKRKDIGSSHNHRWEEHIIYSCECENALEEKKIKNEIGEYNGKLLVLNRRLEELAKLENNQTVNTMKFNKELEKLKNKFDIKE